MKQTPLLEEQSNETYNAVIAAYKALKNSIAQELSTLDITPAQLSVLKLLAKYGTMPLNKISEEMLVTAPNMTGLADRLESKHLIKRLTNGKDRRATMLSLTAQGKRLQEDVSKRYNLFLNDVLSEFTSSDQTTLRRLLIKLEKEILRRKEEKQTVNANA